MFNRDFASTGCAVGIGSLLGGLLSIEIAAHFNPGDFWHFLWIFGALTGGIIAYVIADYKQFCTGVSTAFKKTVAWEPDILYWKSISIFCAGLFTLSFSVLFYISLIPDNLKSVLVVADLFEIAKWSLIFSSCQGFVMFLVLFHSKKENPGGLLTDLLEFGYWLITKSNPVCAPFSIIYYPGKGIYWVLKSLPKMIPPVVAGGEIAYTFLGEAIKNVHSRKRALAFSDAVVGAVIGFMCGNALIGAIVGTAIVFPLHWYFISVRLLGVKPQ